MLTSWGKNYAQSRQHMKKQRQYFGNKGLSSQGYGFSSSHVWLWELVLPCRFLRSTAGEQFQARGASGRGERGARSRGPRGVEMSPHKRVVWSVTAGQEPPLSTPTMLVGYSLSFKLRGKFWAFFFFFLRYSDFISILLQSPSGKYPHVYKHKNISRKHIIR